MDPNQTTNDQPVQDPTGVPMPTGDQIPTTPIESGQVPPVAEPTIPAEPTVPVESVVPAEPIAVPQIPTEGGGVDGDTAPPIPGV